MTSSKVCRPIGRGRGKWYVWIGNLRKKNLRQEDAWAAWPILEVIWINKLASRQYTTCSYATFARGTTCISCHSNGINVVQLARQVHGQTDINHMAAADRSFNGIRQMAQCAPLYIWAWSSSSLLIFLQNTRCSTHTYHSRRQEFCCVWNSLPARPTIKQITSYKDTV